MPDTWISLFLTRSAGYTAQDEIMPLSPKYHWDSLWIEMILEELVLRNRPCNFYETLYGIDKYGGKDTPGNMAVNTRLPIHAL